MKKPDNLKNLRVSTAAVAKILWNAIDAGADAKTMHAICDYISDPAADTPEVEVYAPAYDEAVAETDRATERSRRARVAAARRRSAGSGPEPKPEQSVDETSVAEEVAPEGEPSAGERVCRVEAGGPAVPRATDPMAAARRFYPGRPCAANEGRRRKRVKKL